MHRTIFIGILLSTASSIVKAQDAVISHLNTGEVVGICLSASIFGVLLVVGALYYNSVYPQHMSASSWTSTERPSSIVMSSTWGGTSVRSATNQTYVSNRQPAAHTNPYEEIPATRTNPTLENQDHHNSVNPTAGPNVNPYAAIGAPSGTSAGVEDSDESRVRTDTDVSNTVYGFDANNNSYNNAMRIQADVLGNPAGSGEENGVMEKKSTRRKRGSRFGRGSKRSSRSKNKLGAIEISGPTDFQHLSHLGYDDVAGTAAVSKAEDSVPSTPKGTDDGQHQRPHAYETDAFRIPAPPVQPPVDSASVVPTPDPPAVDSDGADFTSQTVQQPGSVHELPNDAFPDTPPPTTTIAAPVAPVPTPRTRPVTAYDDDDEDFPPPPLAPPAPPPPDDDMDGFDDDEDMF